MYESVKTGESTSPGPGGRCGIKKDETKGKGHINCKSQARFFRAGYIKAPGTGDKGLLAHSSPKGPVPVAFPEILRLRLEPGEEVFQGIGAAVRPRVSGCPGSEGSEGSEGCGGALGAALRPGFKGFRRFKRFKGWWYRPSGDEYYMPLRGKRYGIYLCVTTAA